MELMAWVHVVLGEGVDSIFQEFAIWFPVEERSCSEVDVCVGGEVDVFPLGGIESVVDSESGLQVVME